MGSGDSSRVSYLVEIKPPGTEPGSHMYKTVQYNGPGMFQVKKSLISDEKISNSTENY